MRQVQIVLMAALVVALSAVAYELREIARELAPGAAITYGVAKALTAPSETREQRNQRIQRQQQELMEDVKAMMDTPDAAPKPRVSPNHQKEPRRDSPRQ